MATFICSRTRRLPMLTESPIYGFLQFSHPNPQGFRPNSMFSSGSTISHVFTTCPRLNQDLICCFTCSSFILHHCRKMCIYIYTYAIPSNNDYTCLWLYHCLCSSIILEYYRRIHICHPLKQYV